MRAAQRRPFLVSHGVRGDPRLLWTVPAGPVGLRTRLLARSSALKLRAETGNRKQATRNREPATGGAGIDHHRSPVACFRLPVFFPAAKRLPVSVGRDRRRAPIYGCGPPQLGKGLSGSVLSSRCARPRAASDLRESSCVRAGQRFRAGAGETTPSRNGRHLSRAAMLAFEFPLCCGTCMAARLGLP